MSGTLENIVSSEFFIGEDGEKYFRVHKEILIPRQTYLRGNINGNYRGSKIFEGFDSSKLFDIEIYEAIVTCEDKNDFRTHPFIFPDDFTITGDLEKGKPFPKEKLPNTLPVILSAKEKSFGVNVLEPKLFKFTIDRRHHQVDKDEVYGTFTALISGYILDFQKTVSEEIIGPVSDEILPEPAVEQCTCSKTKTGKSETNNNYIRYEYVCSTHGNCSTWGKYELNRTKVDEVKSGCTSNLLGAIAGLLFFTFIIAVFPGFGYILGILVAVTIINWLAPFLKYIFRGIGVLLLLFFCFGIYDAGRKSSGDYQPKPTVEDNAQERRSVRETDRYINPVVEQSTQKTPGQSDANIEYYPKTIKRFRLWKDYSGNEYSGFYTVELPDFRKSSKFKNGISYNPNSRLAYDKIIYQIKEHDKSKLNGLYHLFDSIATNRPMNKIEFAQMIVSFVQDIPYALILEEGCDAKLYNDRFTKDYLLSNKGDCLGFQRFGLNTPIEFLTTLKGDCDTRTLLLYSILSHYKYDVALLSSEYYSHSLIGVNLPVSGVAFKHADIQYLLWETTTPNARPGQIPTDISNLNNWRISLITQSQNE